jgi:hypothetical protein
VTEDEQILVAMLRKIRDEQRAKAKEATHLASACEEAAQTIESWPSAVSESSPRYAVNGTGSHYAS